MVSNYLSDGYVRTKNNYFTYFSYLQAITLSSVHAHAYERTIVKFFHTAVRLQNLFDYEQLKTSRML